MSVGLFGAYTGSPRLQRAYASGCTGSNSYLVTTDDSLNAAIDDSTVTCVEIQGTITLSSAAPLPVIDAERWVGLGVASPRELDGLTIFGNPADGPDKMEGDQGSPGSGIRMYVDGNQRATTHELVLNISNLTFTNLQDLNSGGAIFAVADAQPGGLNVSLTNVDFIDNKALQGQGGAVYVGARGTGTGVHLDVIESEFHSNTTSNNAVDTYADGGAIYAWSEYGTAVVDVNSSTFTNNSATSTFTSRPSRGGAIAVMSTLGGTAVIVDGSSTFTDNDAVGTSSLGGAIYSDAGVAISGSGDIQFTSNTSGSKGGAVYAAGPVTVAAHARFDYNMATGTPGNGGAIFTTSDVTVSGLADRPVVFSNGTAAGSGGALFAKYGGTVSHAVLERNSAKYGGAAYSTDNGWSFTDSTIRDNDVLEWGAGVYSMFGPVAFYRSSIVANDAAGGSPGGVLAWGGPVVIENSFIGNNTAVTDPGGGVWTDGHVYLRSSTVYDNTTTSPIASELAAARITSTMSVVGNSSPGDVMQFGALDDSHSVSTSTNPAAGFIGEGSDNLEAGQLRLGQLSGFLPGEIGRTPSADSPLALTALNGLAPLVNPLPGITTDQRGFARVAPFTIGARQALTINSVTPSSGDSTGGELVTIHGSAFTGTTSAAIGNSAITNLTVVDDTTITGIAPAGTVGDADVTVTDASSTATLQTASRTSHPLRIRILPLPLPRHRRLLRATSARRQLWNRHT